LKGAENVKYANGGAPSVEEIIGALKKHSAGSAKKTGFLGAFSIGPGVGAAILANATCPACYPAIGAVLSSLGLGFLFEGAYFLVLMSLFFAIALFGLAYKASKRRGLHPFWLGLASALVALAGRGVDLEIVFYLGITGLITASVWNLWPIKVEACPEC